MRWFFYSFGLILSLSLFVNDASANLLESCPYGYRNASTTTGAYPSGAAQFCSNSLYICSAVSPSSFVSYYGDPLVDFDYVTPSDCAKTPADDIAEDGCYESDLSLNSQGLLSCHGQDKETCYDSNGSSVDVVAGKSCSDYCSGDNPQTPDRVEQYSLCSKFDGTTPEGEPLSESDPNDPGYDPDAEPSCPAGYVMEGSQCVGLEDNESDCPAGYTFEFGECSGPPNDSDNPDPDNPDPDNPDPDNPDPDNPDPDNPNPDNPNPDNPNPDNPDPDNPDPDNSDPDNPDPDNPDPDNPDPDNPDPGTGVSSQSVTVDNSSDITGPITSKLDAVIDAIGDIPGGGGNGPDPYEPEEPDDEELTEDAEGVADQVLSDADQSMNDSYDEYSADFDSLMEEEFEVDTSGIESQVTDVLPGYSACSEYTMAFPKLSLSLKCERFEQFKQIFSWALYLWTLFHLFDIALRPVEAK